MDKTQSPKDSSVSPRAAYTFVVQGRVQGVGFRWSTQEEARRLGLVGWVKNEDDGSVSGLAQGPEESLTAFRRWLARGPSGALVDRVKWTEATPTGLRMFTIKA